MEYQEEEQGRSLLMLIFLLKDDIEEGDLNRPEMIAKLVCTLENAIHKAMQEKQYSAVATNAKVLMRLLGLDELRKK